MRDLARITLFVHDRKGRFETVPDQAVLWALLQETPLITHHEDGSRTLVFDLVPNSAKPEGPAAAEAQASLDLLRLCGEALGQIARSLGLPLTAALAESAEKVAEAELRGQPGPGQH